ncbi:hypothetical protein SAMN02745121_08489 [Nannocystis exedens]|uniref:Uncharacterized protein n=1 Tax=Nannocystis exedens TaxID=54 RepID=A0A1I2I8U8_9BACT|nr:hypothetical protein NAEX_07217 [Nannocystis exedens]SFF38083.1 hypothetical protein SAMN02745121_08489 [Nannocystis exedens]
MQVVAVDVPDLEAGDLACAETRVQAEEHHQAMGEVERRLAQHFRLLLVQMRALARRLRHFDALRATSRQCRMTRR